MTYVCRAAVGCTPTRSSASSSCAAPANVSLRRVRLMKPGPATSIDEQTSSSSTASTMAAASSRGGRPAFFPRAIAAFAWKSPNCGDAERRRTGSASRKSAPRTASIADCSRVVRTATGGGIRHRRRTPGSRSNWLEKMDALPHHLLPLTASIASDGRLSVGGCDVTELTEAHGTPLFVYDEEHLRARCREAVSAWGDGVAYASKAFLCKAMAALADEEGMCIDVSTGGELHVALAAGVPADRLVLHGNNKSMAELTQACEAGVGRIVVDSFDEIDRLEALSMAGAEPQVLV